MAKRSNSNVPSFIEEVDYTVSSDTLDKSDVVSYTNTEQSKRVVNKFPATISLKGLVTGKLYRWENAGSVVEVAEEDVADLLTKKIGESSCCGSNQKGNIVFEVV